MPTRKPRSESSAAPVRPANVPKGGLWFAPETIAQMEAQRAANAAAKQTETSQTISEPVKQSKSF